MDVTIIAKNVSTEDVSIPDLGITIPVGDQRDLTAEFSLDEIDSSSDLVDLVDQGKIVINNGERDLDIDDAIDQISLETVYTDNEYPDVIYHSQLQGLDQNDHPQYALVSDLQDPNGNHDFVDWSQIKNAPPIGSDHWLDPVATINDLPTTANAGDCILVQDDGDGKAAQYSFDGTNWVKISDVDWSPITNINQIPNRLHSNLQGLYNDDHPQYLNQNRGDDRYYTKPEVDNLVRLDYNDVSSNDPNTDITGTELERLSNGSDITTQLHKHSNYPDKNHNESIEGKWSFSDGRLVIPVVTSFPPSPSVGEIVYRSDLDKRYLWNGDHWTSQFTITNHGDLDGLDQDDHHQYLLCNGSRAMSGHLLMANHPIRDVDCIDFRNRTSTPHIETSGTVWYRSDKPNLYCYFDNDVTAALQPSQVLHVCSRGRQNLNTNGTKIKWDHPDIIDNIYSVDKDKIYLKECGIYEVSFCVSVYNRDLSAKGIRAELRTYYTSSHRIRPLAICYNGCMNRYYFHYFTLSATTIFKNDHDNSILELLCRRVSNCGTCYSIGCQATWITVKLLRFL